MKTYLTHILPVFFLTLMSIGVYLLWRSITPFPHTLNWDIWEHQTVINAIRGGSMALLPSDLSDTFRFDGYTTAYHVLIAAIQSLTNTQNILGFWWIAEGVFLTLTTLATYAFCFAYTKHRWTALIGGILSACFFESSMAYTTLFLVPQTLAALVWVIGMTVLVQKRTYQLPVAVGFALIAILLHGIVGGVGAVMLLLFVLSSRLHPLAPVTKILVLLLAAAAGYALPTGATHLFATHTINAGEAAYFSQPIVHKLSLFHQWYGLLPIPFLLLGMWQIVKTNHTSAWRLLVLFAGSTGVILSAFPYVLKFTVFTHYLMIAVMSIGIYWILKQLHAWTSIVLSICFVGITAGMIFLSNTHAWKEPVVQNTIASHVSEDEQRAAVALSARYAKTDALLLSDPATQYILEPLSGVNSPGGAYMDRENRLHLIQAFGAADQETFAKEIRSVTDRVAGSTQGPIVLIINGRTRQWLNQEDDKRLSIASNIWKPQPLSLADYLATEQWKKQFDLKEVYRNTSIVILEYSL
jgi:hypothetical protein